MGKQKHGDHKNEPSPEKPDEAFKDAKLPPGVPPPSDELIELLTDARRFIAELDARGLAREARGMERLLKAVKKKLHDKN